MKDLLNALPSTDGNFKYGIIDNSTSAENIEVYFRNIEFHLKNHIEKADCVFGCIAWLTSKSILSSLEKPETCIVVQKEDFLRPDVDSNQSNWAEVLRDRYAKLHSKIYRNEFPGIVKDLSFCSGLSNEPVRCVGNYNRDKKPAFPRMHNKFLIFAKRFKAENDYLPDAFYPYGVWTGSFNFTENATRSLENALYIENEQIVGAYWSEFEQIYSISEPLDWSEDWIAPEWRIGS